MGNDKHKVNGHEAEGPRSLGDYAKHRGCSKVSVSKAIKRERLVKSVVFVDGKPKIKDFKLADQEWAQNTDYSRRPAAAPAPAPRMAGAKGPDWKGQLFSDFSVCRDTRLRRSDGERGCVVLFCNVDSDDLDADGTVWPMTTETARELGRRLIEASTQTEDDFLNAEREMAAGK
jgi:hypothetical protein